MFTNQLLESAKDELSFRTLVRDLKTKSPMLQIVLLNPNAWCCTGYCSGMDSTAEPISKLDLQPIIKVLFSDCGNHSESQSRLVFYKLPASTFHLMLKIAMQLLYCRKIF